MSSDTLPRALWKSRPDGIDGDTLPGVLVNGNLAVRGRSRTDSISLSVRSEGRWWSHLEVRHR
jgi:hypothetical protein